MQIALEGKKTKPSRKLEVRKTKTIDTQKLKVSSFVSAGTVFGPVGREECRLTFFLAEKPTNLVLKVVGRFSATIDASGRGEFRATLGGGGLHPRSEVDEALATWTLTP